MKVIDKILYDLEESISTNHYKRIEDEKIELKDNSHTGGQWNKLLETVCSFLNTDSGIIIIGIYEDVKNKKYELKGFNFNNEPTLKDSLKKFKDENNHAVDISKHIHFEQKELLGKQIMVMYVDSLPADEKYVFYDGIARKRVMSADEAISKIEIDAQSEHKRELRDAREMQLVINASLDDLDLDKLNQYIQLSNAEYKTQNILSSIDEAVHYLTMNGMYREKHPTILGMLVCGKNTEYFLHWKSQVDAYVELPSDLPINKKVINDNVIPLLEESTRFIFRNIQTGISVKNGGTKTFEYPEKLIRECINNSLAHRDYTIDQFINVNILPSKHIQIKNPGRFKKQLLIIDEKTEVPVRRIVPNNPKANNPKLAKVLNVFNKWEGKGWGMKRLVSSCLDGNIDLPYYIFHSWDELSLFIPKGNLVDETVQAVIDAYSKYITDKLKGEEITEEQKRIFAYFYKSEIANRNERWTLLLTKNNNHLNAINSLDEAGLIYKHPVSDEIYSVYVVDRLFFKTNFYPELKELFGERFNELKTDHKEALNAIYLHKNYSLKNKINAYQIGDYLYYKNKTGEIDLKEYDSFKRKIRRLFNMLEKSKFIIARKVKTKSGRDKTEDYTLNAQLKASKTLFD